MSIDDYVLENKEVVQTGIVHLINPATGKKIDLIATDHIGRPEYYESIKQRLNEADYVLHEGQKKRNRFYEKSAKNITKYQQRLLRRALNSLIEQNLSKKEKYQKVEAKLKKKLHVISQTKAINYKNLPNNWIAADLKPREFVKKLSFMSILFGSLSQIFCSYKFHNKFLKRKDVKKIHTLREQKVYNLVSEIQQKPDTSNLAILYGADHMPAIETNLQKMGYVRDSQHPAEYLISQIKAMRALEKQ